METPTSTRELVGNEREEARESRSVERERDGERRDRRRRPRRATPRARTPTYATTTARHRRSGTAASPRAREVVQR